MPVPTPTDATMAAPGAAPAATVAIVDGHLDLGSLAVAGRDLLADRPQDASGCVTLPALRRGGVVLACATLFTESGADPESNPLAYRGPQDWEGASAAARRQLEWYESMEARGALRIVRRSADLPGPGADLSLRSADVRNGHGSSMANPQSDAEPLPVVLLMECADPIRDPEEAEWWVKRGVRMVGLSWARGSRFAGGNAAPGGLTAAGRDLLRALDDLGVIHDLSHLSDGGFEDVMSLVRGPVVASHSNCRALAGESQRHLTDAQIQAIGARGGVVGLNLFGRFLVRDRRATIEDCVAHVRRVHDLAGVAATGLGSDLDGGFTPEDLPVGLETPERLPRLLAALEGTGVDVASFAHCNWLRVLREGLARCDASATT